jgi:hypothetical protein
MKNAVVSSMLFAAIAIAGCNKDQQQANGEANQAATASKPAATAKKAPRRLTAEQLARIGASGKTGLWADPAEVCSARAKRRAGTTLEWNVQATGNKAVVLYLMESKGKVRRVTSGDAIGGKPVGGWVRPGTTFVLRAPGNPQDLGKVVIGKKGC